MACLIEFIIVDKDMNLVWERAESEGVGLIIDLIQHMGFKRPVTN